MYLGLEQQNSEDCSQGFQKTSRRNSNVNKKDFGEKIFVAILCMRKPCFYVFKVRISSQKSVQNMSGKQKTEFQPAVPKQLSKWGPDPSVSSLLLPWSPRVLPRCNKIGPQRANIQAPCPPKWQPRGAKRGRRQRAWPFR